MRPLILSILVATAACLPAADEWPRWRGPGADGRWNPPGVPADFAKRQPKELWRVKIGSGFSGVTVSQGRVYLMDYDKEEKAEAVRCFEAASGRELWHHAYPAAYGKMDYPTGPRSSVVIEHTGGESSAYTLGPIGMACRLDAATGRVVWQKDTVKEFGAKIPTWGFAASPFLRNDKVILHVAAQPGGCLLALDKKTGKEIWRAGDDRAGYCTPELIEHNGRQQLIGWGPEFVQSYDPDTGALNWKHPYKITYGVSIAQPVYAEGMLIVSGYWHGAKAYQLGSSPKDSVLAWEQEKEICGLMSAPLCKNGLVCILDKNSGLTCFEARTGKVRWTDGNQLTPKDRNPQMSLVWLDEGSDLIAALNASGEIVYARLKADGIEELGRHQVIGKTWAHPAFAGNRIYARSDTELAAWVLW